MKDSETEALIVYPCCSAHFRTSVTFLLVLMSHCVFLASMSPMMSAFGTECFLAVSSVVCSSFLVAAGEIQVTEIENSPNFVATSCVLSDLCLSTVSLSMSGFQASSIPAFLLLLFSVGSAVNASYFIGRVKRFVGRAQVSLKQMTFRYVESISFCTRSALPLRPRT